MRLLFLSPYSALHNRQEAFFFPVVPSSQTLFNRVHKIGWWGVNVGQQVRRLSKSDS